MATTYQPIATLIEQVDAQLPQIHCEKCDYPGCRPYAEAMVRQGVPINKCQPGGASTVAALAKTLQRPNPGPPVTSISPWRQLAVIDEAQCIGCTKCLQVCPVDAIVGAAKKMHTVLADACTGCELCIPACPVACIELIADPKKLPNSVIDGELPVRHAARQGRAHYVRRQLRLRAQRQQKMRLNQQAKQLDIKAELKACLARNQAKKHALSSNSYD
jgi:electron transport complex protein RnfB